MAEVGLIPELCCSPLFWGHCEVRGPAQPAPVWEGSPTSSLVPGSDKPGSSGVAAGKASPKRVMRLWASPSPPTPMPASPWALSLSLGTPPWLETLKNDGRALAQLLQGLRLRDREAGRRRWSVK